MKAIFAIVLSSAILTCAGNALAHSGPYVPPTASRLAGGDSKNASLNVSRAEKFAAYQVAARIALSEAHVTCSFSEPELRWTNGGTIASALNVTGTSDAIALNAQVNYAQRAELTQSGVLPVLTFYRDGFFTTALALTISADHNSIVSAEYGQYIPMPETTNIGTMTDPKIVKRELKTDVVSASCR